MAEAEAEAQAQAGGRGRGVVRGLPDQAKVAEVEDLSEQVGTPDQLEPAATVLLGDRITHTHTMSGGDGEAAIETTQECREQLGDYGSETSRQLQEQERCCHAL